jgi:tripartite-type tricarboxylate transporter receptor subunit TctC
MPERDFAPVTLVLGQPNVLAVHPSLPVKSVKEFIALGRSQPGALNYASGGAGNNNHLAAELFAGMAGIKVTHVPLQRHVPRGRGALDRRRCTSRSSRSYPQRRT